MNKHDEQFDKTISRLSKEMSGFNGLATIQLLKELHELHTILDDINDSLDNMDTSFTGIGDVIADAGDSIAESVGELNDED